MVTRPSLQARPGPRSVPTDDVKDVESLPIEEQKSPPQSAARSYRSPARVGKKPITAYVEPETAKGLNIHAVKFDLDVQAMATEAIKDFCEKHRIAWYG